MIENGYLNQSSDFFSPFSPTERSFSLGYLSFQETTEQYKLSQKQIQAEYKRQEYILAHIKFCRSFEQVLKQVIETLSIASLNYSKALSKLHSDIHSGVSLSSESTFNPDKVLSIISEAERSGKQHPQPIHTTGLFNCPLSFTSIDPEHGSIFVKKLLLRIKHQQIIEVAEQRIDVLDLWIDSHPSEMTFDYRNQLSMDNYKDLLKGMSALEAIRVLFLYLMELPDALVQFDLYDSLKLLYLSKSEDFDFNLRIGSVKSLLSTLDSAHFYTLAWIIGLLVDVFDGDCQSPGPSSLDKRNKITILYQTLARVMVRPQKETSVSIHDRFGSRLIRDLIIGADTFFGPRRADASSTSLMSDSEDNGGVFDEDPVDDEIFHSHDDKDSEPKTAVIKVVEEMGKYQATDFVLE